MACYSAKNPLHLSIAWHKGDKPHRCESRAFRVGQVASKCAPGELFVLTVPPTKTCHLISGFRTITQVGRREFRVYRRPMSERDVVIGEPRRIRLRLRFVIMGYQRNPFLIPLLSRVDHQIALLVENQFG